MDQARRSFRVVAVGLGPFGVLGGRPQSVGRSTQVGVVLFQVARECAPHHGSSGRPASRPMTGPVLWRISEVPLTTFDSCLWLQNGLWQAIRAVFMSSHDNCKYTIGYPLTGA